MQHSDENRRYLAKVSRAGIIAATVYALIYGLVSYRILRMSYGEIVTFRYALTCVNNILPELMVVAVGLLGLTVCGILSLAMKKSPDLAERGWIMGGRITLLAMPVGYIQSLCGLNPTVTSNTTDLPISFAVLTAVFVGYALGLRGLSVNQHFLHTDKKTYTLRVLRNTAILCGVMLGSVLLLMLRTWVHYRGLFAGASAAQQLHVYVIQPLVNALPVLPTVPLGSLFLSLVARLDKAPAKRLMGKGSILTVWMALAAMTVSQILSISWQVIMLHYTASMIQSAERIQTLQMWASFVATLLSVLALCRVLAYTKDSKLVLWGMRSVLVIVALRYLMASGLRAAQLALLNSGGMDLYVKIAQAESWVAMILTALSAVALCVMAVGLIRQCRVGKGFWAVPALTLASLAATLIVSLIWTSLSQNMRLETAEWIRIIALTAIPAVISLIRNAVGIIALLRAPAGGTTATDCATPAEEAPKPRVEDYLMQL